MDISKLTDQEKLAVCRKFFRIGFFFLPLVWAVNFFWFFSDAFCSKTNTVTRKQIRKFVILSGVGAFIWIAAFVIWETIFQSYRNQGVPWADYITFVYPKGRI